MKKNQNHLSVNRVVTDKAVFNDDLRVIILWKFSVSAILYYVMTDSDRFSDLRTEEKG